MTIGKKPSSKTVKSLFYTVLTSLAVSTHQFSYPAPGSAGEQCTPVYRTVIKIRNSGEKMRYHISVQNKILHDE